MRKLKKPVLSALSAGLGITPAAAKALQPVIKPSSILKVFDIPHELLVASADNPNEQNEMTFDQVVEGMRRDGFDEPIIVIPAIEGSEHEGKYIIVSGHHRAKAAKVVGLPAVPAVVKEGWDDDKRKIELVRRNNLRGSIDPIKFTKLVNELRGRGFDESVLKLQMGFTEAKRFEALFKRVATNMPPAVRAKLEEAKEEVKSVDDLSNVVNRIFREHGSDLDHNFIVFSQGGKSHMMVIADKELFATITKTAEDARARGVDMCDVFKNALLARPSTGVAPSPKVQAKKDARK